MKDRSQIVMLVGLTVLILAVLTLSPSIFHMHPFAWGGGSFRWILLAVAIWFIFGKRGGCCCRGSKSAEG